MPCLMRFARFFPLVSLLAPLPAGATPPDHSELLKLAPAARMEQRCNAKAMGTIDHDHHEMHPDELVAYAFADPVTKGTTLQATGAAVRSRGKWYRLSYVCQTADEGTQVVTFTYSLGSVVPRDEWESHYLVP